MKTKNIEQVRPQGFLAELLSDIDEKEMKRTENRMLLAIKIAEALKQKHISQKEFANMMGKSTTVISEWLSGDRNFTIDTLTDISVALSVSLIDTDMTCMYVIPNTYQIESTIKATAIKSRGELSVYSTTEKTFSIKPEKNKPLAI